MATDRPVLRLEHLRKTFGALVATDDVSLDVLPGEIHALIGPNGAGKTTLVAQISGEIRPNVGRVHLNGSDVTGLKTFERARAGLARSFQITQICADFTVLENVLLSLEARDGGALDLFSDPRRNLENRAAAEHWIGRVGLGAARDRRASALAHGELRQLELAVALCRDPKLLVLDEPMAGMGPEETQRLTALLQDLKGQYAILLIEHDMDVVFSLADRVSVLVYGRVIFTGTVAEVRTHPEVRAAYLGDDDAPA